MKPTSAPLPERVPADADRGVDLINEHWAFFSTEPAGRREIRYAWIAVLFSALLFLVAAPYTKTPLAQLPAFIPTYVASLVICHLITASLLFGQFSVLRTTSLLILAGGYLFTAAITFAYALVFPGLFALSWLPAAGPQTSSAMYVCWHVAFPLSVIAYARSKSAGQGERKAPRRIEGSPAVAIGLLCAGIVAAVCGYTLFATLGHDTIPVVLNGDTTTTLGHMVLFLVWGLSVLTLIVLWRSGPHTMLDIWLLVTMCVWVFDIAMAALLNNGRYDLGWYVGRIYGLVAASCLLILLLLENGRQYARLVRMSVELSAANQALAQLTRHDGLTGLANRRYFDEYLAQQTGLAQRHKRALALVLCDVDHFKAYNDHYGHPAGDECLKQVALVLRASSLRAADMPARYGGEEFAMILPETELAGAIEVAEAARTALLRLRIPHCHSSADGCLSMSFGVAVMVANADMAAEELIAMADLALYEAKRQGRNRVLRAGQDSPAY